MDKLLKKKPLYQHEPPPETKEEWQAEIDRGKSLYGALFKNSEEFEYFWMLPLNDNQRRELLKQLYEEKKVQDELLICKGVLGQAKEHRALCIPCCTLFRPTIAEPFY